MPQAAGRIQAHVGQRPAASPLPTPLLAGRSLAGRSLAGRSLAAPSLAAPSWAGLLARHPLAGLLLIAFLPTALGAQEPPRGQPRPGPVVHVSGDAPRLHHAEPHLSLDPTDPSHLLAAAVALPDGRAHRVDVFRSVDGGRTWVRESLPVPPAVAARSVIDPWTAVGPDGTGYVSILAWPDGTSSRTVPWVFERRPSDADWRRLVTVDGPGGGSFDQQKIVVRSTGDVVLTSQRNGRRTERGNATQTVALAVVDPARPGEFRMDHLAENNVEKNAMNVVALPDGTTVTGYFGWARMGGSGRLGLLWTLVADAARPSPLRSRSTVDPAACRCRARPQCSPCRARCGPSTRTTDAAENTWGWWDSRKADSTPSGPTRWTT